MAKKKITLPDYEDIGDMKMHSAFALYTDWKKLDGELSVMSTRGLNFPSVISEIVACYVLKYQLKLKGRGDAYDPLTERIIEIKATSSKTADLSTFSPAEEFDELVFIRVDKANNKAYVYETGFDSNALKSIMVNNTETVGDHQKAGRRPRFSIEKKIIAPKGLKPVYTINLATREINPPVK